MKITLSALLIITALTCSAKSFAASSMCEVFIGTSDNADKPYETVTTCDGKQGAIAEFDDSSVGTVAPLTKATQLVLAKGYNLVNCTGTGVNQACFLIK